MRGGKQYIYYICKMDFLSFFLSFFISFFLSFFSWILRSMGNVYHLKAAVSDILVYGNECTQEDFKNLTNVQPTIG